MPEPTITATTIAKMLTPLVTELFKGAKGGLEKALNKSNIIQTTNLLAETLNNIDKVRTIWSAEEDLSLDSFYYPSKLKQKDKSQTISSIDDLPKGDLIIEGTVGQGKSIFMRYLSLSIVRNNGKGLIPIFIELRSISKEKNLKQAIEFFLEGCGFKNDAFAPLAKSKKIVLLLDGYDEISVENEAGVIEHLISLRRNYPLLKIIISSRPNNSIQNVVGFEVTKLVPLTENDYEPFMKKLGIDIFKRTALIQAVTDSPTKVSGVITTPLMLTLVIIVYETEQEIPTTLSEFYEKLFYIVFTRHDRLKVAFNRQHHTGLSERKLQKLFEAFCFMVVQAGHGRSLESNEFNSCFDKAIKYSSDISCEVEKFKNDIIKVACLMLEEGLSKATFIHKSILDYFASSFVSKLSEGLKEKFYQRATSDFSTWEHVLHFLKDIDTFSYSKYYILTSYPKILPLISRIIESKSTDEFIKALEELRPNTGIGLDPTTLMVRSWGNGFAFESEVTQKLDSLLMGYIIGAMSKASEEKKREAIKNSLYTQRIFKNSEHMNYRGFFLTFGHENIVSLFKVANLEAIEEFKKAEATIAQEEKKNLLFD